jgi:hypothetical protein
MVKAERGQGVMPPVYGWHASGSLRRAFSLLAGVLRGPAAGLAGLLIGYALRFLRRSLFGALDRCARRKRQRGHRNKCELRTHVLKLNDMFLPVKRERMCN